MNKYIVPIGAEFPQANVIAVLYDLWQPTISFLHQSFAQIYREIVILMTVSRLRVEGL